MHLTLEPLPAAPRPGTTASDAGPPDRRPRTGAVGSRTARTAGRLDARRVLVALAAGFVATHGALAAERPTDPARWPGLKDVYKNYFLIGSTNLSASNFATNVVPGENSVAAMTVKHFNAVTPSNALKPEFWSGGISNTNPSFLTNLTSGINADISAANARDVKVTGHVLVWHNQSAQWPAANVLTSTGGWETPWDYATAKTNLEYYIRTVAGHFDQAPFKTYAWDVVNEAFKDNPDNPADWRNALRTGYSPEERPSRWAQAYAKGGKSWEYMYDAFYHARQNTTAILNYNDFNDNERASKAMAIASMVKEFNERYAAESAAGKGRVLLDAKGNPRQLVDVIGTQGHWDMRLNLDAFERTIKTYLETGANVDLTELDLAPTLGLDKGQRIQNGPEMDALFKEQGIQYAKLFSLLKEYAAGPGGRHPEYKGGVHRVTWWGMTDPGYHTNGYPWSAVGQPKEAYWATTDPEQYLIDAGLPPNGVTATFSYGGETFKARTWGGKNAQAMLDINVPASTRNVAFTAANVSLPAGFAVESMKFNPPDCAVVPGKPCHVTVTARGAAPATTAVENTATFVLSFGKMTVGWMDAANALEAPYSYAEVRFSDGVTPFKQYKTSYGSDGMARASGVAETRAVPRHGRTTLVLLPQDPIAGPFGLKLQKDASTEKAWRLVTRFEPGRTYMVVSGESVFDGKKQAAALTNRSKPATTASPESLSRTPVILRGDILVPSRNTNAPDTEPALAQDNLKFVFEEAKSPAAGPYANQEGHTMQSFIHGTNVYPQIVFRGNGAAGTAVGGRTSLITRQTNGQEGSQIAERNLDQAVWFNTPIDPTSGEMKLFLYSEKDGVKQYHVLTEVADGETPARDAGNAISQRQGAVGGFVAVQADGTKEGTGVKLYAYDIASYTVDEAPTTPTTPTTPATPPSAESTPAVMPIAPPFSRKGGSLDFGDLALVLAGLAALALARRRRN
ncbi:endo-1,4-beta-xylanase [Pseudacidovorax sp. RU35E]|uniref:endo-1,4-beta-xylanase n=1 Tax=Pseudacidovorax sp. RU35E TaxID=1907403 RepID=UPI0009556CE3|nr:endo-1,4-beta-xylanase [Pseudacidovorax sp. RU35E]SIQ51113.1 Endo-1,4-beta-xylanase, GH35 family [Pseudacidovorax sp. RU35E]